MVLNQFPCLLENSIILHFSSLWHDHGHCCGIKCRAETNMDCFFFFLPSFFNNNCSFIISIFFFNSYHSMTVTCVPQMSGNLRSWPPEWIMTPWVHATDSENAGECICWVLGRCLWTAVRRRTDTGQGFNTPCDSAKGPALWVWIMSSLENLVCHTGTLAPNSTNLPELKYAT